MLAYTAAFMQLQTLLLLLLQTRAASAAASVTLTGSPNARPVAQDKLEWRACGCASLAVEGQQHERGCLCCWCEVTTPGQRARASEWTKR